MNKRPTNNAAMSVSLAEEINKKLQAVRDEVDRHAAHLRSLDRRRLNGVGIKTLGFIERSLDLAKKNGEFLPHWLTESKFRDDLKRFEAIDSMLDLATQLRLMVLSLQVQAADMVYTDALEFYASARDAVKRGVAGAESLSAELSEFFKSRGNWKKDLDNPTQAQIKRDANALLQGKKDGEIIIENISPKAKKGEKNAIDEIFSQDERR